MFRLTVIAAFLVCAKGAILPPVPMLDGRIVGGTPADIEEVPYQVALLMGSATGDFYQSCGGSIITKTVIVTAAHCTNETSPAQWRVRAGSTYHNDGGQVVKAFKIIQHSNFTSRLDSDISLIILESELILGEGVATVSILAQGVNVPDGSMALVTGWGHLSEGGANPTQLYKVLIPIVNQQECVDAYAGFNPVTKNMICAGRLGVGGQDACQGDSGGPLTVNGILTGITSWGRGCAQAQYPGVWTKVSAFTYWIIMNA